MLFFVALTLAWDDARPRHLDLAAQLLAQVAPSDTSYRHKNNRVRWKSGDQTAECHADCSGFVNAVLVEATQKPASALKDWFGAARPLARHYYRTIVAEKRFRRIVHVAEVEPGDVLAIEYPKDNDNTGHVVLVAEKPARQTPPSEPKIDGAEAWTVVVLDCTSAPHSRDTRTTKDGASRAGLGKGSMRIYTDAKGEIVGHTWGLSARSQYRAQSERPTAIGRFIYPEADGEKRP